MNRALLSLDQVARLLRGDEPGARAWFYKHWQMLVATRGFPPPVEGLGKRWDPVAVHWWLDQRLPLELRPPAPARQDDPLAAELAKELDRCAGAIAAGLPVRPMPSNP